ncbi:MAG: hypothetical protein BMS9Abin07_0842 [Acidimicrobiia bacterium]|nr:MAG: hypothetical protein BMS9Abin07_0842 [Acidimicrobiia bacterium]
MSEPRDPTDWTDPYDDLSDLTGAEPVPPLEDPNIPPATPPGSPLLTGLVVGLLLVALSVAVFQLLTGDETPVAGDTTTTTAPGGTTTTTEPGPSTTTTSPLPPSDPYPPVGEPIPVGQMKLMTDRVRVQSAEIPDLAFGDVADLVVGALTASFGDPDEDNGWQVSTGEWGVCVGDLERVVRFGPFAAIVTMVDDADVFNGYRQDVGFGDLGSPASQLETLSGLRAGDTVGDLKRIYASQTVEFATDATGGEVFELRGAESNDLILWGPVAGQADEDPVIGIYAPDLCTR